MGSTNAPAPRPGFRDSAAMLLDSISSKLRTAGDWKWNYPSPSTPSPFPSAYADVHYQTWYRRVPAAYFVAQSVAFDAWEKGFHIKQLDDEEATEVYNAFDSVLIPGLPNAHALSRLFGHSCLLLGFNDLPKSQWDKEVEWDKAKLKWTLPVGKPDMIVTDWVGIPEEPKILGVSCYPDLPMDIHSSRFFYLENPDITDPSRHGMSVLEPIGDVLSITRDSIWSVGQRIWRAAVGLITIKGPKGLKSDVRDEVLENYMDINSKFVNYLPQDWELQVDGLGKSVTPVVDDINILLGQIAMASRVPLSYLIGAQKGAVAGGERDERDYWQTLSVLQNTFCRPLVKESLDILEKTHAITLPDNYTIKFNPIRERSHMERAQDIAGEALAEGLAELLKDPDLPREKLIEFAGTFLQPGSFRAPKM